MRYLTPAPIFNYGSLHFLFTSTRRTNVCSACLMRHVGCFLCHSTALSYNCLSLYIFLFSSSFLFRIIFSIYLCVQFVLSLSYYFCLSLYLSGKFSPIFLLLSLFRIAFSVCVLFLSHVIRSLSFLSFLSFSHSLFLFLISFSLFLF